MFFYIQKDHTFVAGSKLCSPRGWFPGEQRACRPRSVWLSHQGPALPAISRYLGVSNGFQSHGLPKIDVFLRENPKEIAGWELGVALLNRKRPSFSFCLVLPCSSHICNNLRPTSITSTTRTTPTWMWTDGSGLIWACLLGERECLDWT